MVGRKGDLMQLIAKFDKSSKNYEVYKSMDHNCILTLYIPKEEFDGAKPGARPPASISIDVHIVEGVAKR
jgi:hypothetical protein